jgi:hypothetical protein
MQQVKEKFETFMYLKYRNTQYVSNIGRPRARASNVHMCKSTNTHAIRSESGVMATLTAADVDLTREIHRESTYYELQYYGLKLFFRMLTSTLDLNIGKVQ